MRTKKWNLMLILLAGCFFIYQNVWALITPFDPRIWERDLIQIGIRTPDIQHIQTDLALSDRANEQLIVKHVITTGGEKANEESLALSIKTLESIRPKLNIFAQKGVIKLSPRQVHYVMKALRKKSIEIPEWLKNPRQQKYINIVLQKPHSDRYSPISIDDAHRLLTWAVKNKVIYRQDHPSFRKSV